MTGWLFNMLAFKTFSFFFLSRKCKHFEGPDVDTVPCFLTFILISSCLPHFWQLLRGRNGFTLRHLCFSALQTYVKNVKRINSFSSYKRSDWIIAMEVALVRVSFRGLHLPFRKSWLRHPVNLVVLAVTWKRTATLCCQPLCCQPICSHWWFHWSMGKKKERVVTRSLSLLDMEQMMWGKAQKSVQKHISSSIASF